MWSYVDSWDELCVPISPMDTRDSSNGLTVLCWGGMVSRAAVLKVPCLVLGDWTQQAHTC